MRKLFYSACILALALSVSKAHAQTGIAINNNGATADQSAMLDVSVSGSAQKGFLLPRVTSAQRDAISLPAKGLMVYVTSVDSLEINIGTPASPKWFAFGYASNTVSGWQVKGNTGTNIATDFVGTSDNVDLAFRTNNFERLRISNAGNVGIGNTAPTQKLDVTGSVRFSGALMPNGDPGTLGYFLVSAGPGVPPVWVNGDGYAWYIDGNSVAADKKFGTKTNFNLPFITNNIERMRITNSGFVGIGTTAPTNTLHVSAVSNPLALTGVVSGATTDSLLTIDPATGVVRRLAASRFAGWSYGGDAVAATTTLGTTSNFDLPFIANGSEWMRLTKTGNFGIGTTAPAYKLQVTAATNPLALGGVQSGATTDSLLTIDPVTGVVRRMAFSRLQDWSYGGDAVTAVTNLGTTSSFDLPIITANTERMRIASNGKITMGATTVANTLSVSASSNPLTLTGVQAGTTTDSLLTINTTTGIVNRVSADRFKGWSYNGDAVTALATIGTKANFDFPIITNSTERVRVTTAGNVGIGTSTPSNRLTVVNTSADPLALYGVQVGTQTSTDSVLTISNGIVKKIPLLGSIGSSTNWSLSGNTTTNAFLGTINDYALSIRVNNTAAGYIGKSSEATTTFGYGATAITWAVGATAFGANASAQFGSTTAVGYNALANNGYSCAFGSDAKAPYANTVAVGSKSNASGNYATAIGSNSVAQQECVVVGFNASASSNENVVIGSSANATYQSIAIGKLAETDANNCVAIGYRARALNQNSIAIGLNVTTPASNDMISIGNSSNSSVLLCGATDNSKALVVGTGNGNGNGAYLTKGGVWSNASDKNLKESITKVSGADVLAKLMSMDVTKWKYKGTNEYHIGPMAQDFFAAFSLGTDDKHISSIDPAGVALVAIQELKKENEELTKRVDDQQKLLEQLLKEVNELKAKVK